MSTDRNTIKTVVYTLAVIAVGGFIAQVALAAIHTTIPDSLDRYSFGALTALMAMLSKTSSNDDAPQDVQVVNEPSEPVPVEPPAVPPPPIQIAE